jgi:HEPN domain-containing protein
MTKQEHIIYWKESSLQDFETVRVLYEGKRYMMSLFVCHLAIEKLLKAHWVKDNKDNFPPFTHNLELLHNQTLLNLSNEQLGDLKLINAWNIEGRYEDYNKNFYRLCSKEYTERQLKMIENLKECLLKTLP